MKQALGLAFSGTEVRLAHLTSHKGWVRIEGLERAKLRSSLEHQSSEKTDYDQVALENKDVFGLGDSLSTKGQSESTERKDTANLEILYGLIEKYVKKKTRIAFNIPLSMVNYQQQDSPFAPAISERLGLSEGEGGSNLGHEVLESPGGTTISMAYECHPPTLTLLRGVKDFLRGNLYLGLMDTTEVALANIARNGPECEFDEISTIVYIEDEFTRLVFLRGKDLLHVSSIIHERVGSPDILEVIYRKIMYEQDEAQIPEIAHILLAGRSSRINAIDFFAERFEKATVSYLYSDKLGGFPSNNTQREAFSAFAVPIALAWKVLEPKQTSFIPLNLLPQDLQDEQQVLKLDYRGYVLLALTGLMAFFFTWQVLRIRGESRKIRSENVRLETQIKNNQSTVDRVLELEDQCKRLRKNMALADSLSQGHDEFLAFLKKLNRSVRQTGGLWVDEIVKQQDGFSVKGTSLNREKIPLLAEKLEQANLRKVTRNRSAARKMFQFELERRSAPSNFEFAEQGVRIIDVSSSANSRNLVLSNDGAHHSASPSKSSTDARVAQGRATRGSRDAGKVQPKNRSRPKPASQTASLTRGRNKSAVVSKANPPVRPANSGPKRSRQSSGGWEGAQLAEASTRTAPGNGATGSRDGHSSSPGRTDHKVSANQPPAGKTDTKTGNKPAGNSTRKRAARAPASAPAVRAIESPRGYTILAATSYTRTLAEQVAKSFRQRGMDAAVDAFDDGQGGTSRYRVLVGAFATRQEAEKQAEQLSGLLQRNYRIVALK